MANKKISDYTAVTTLADGDLLEIETVGGNSRKITVANALAALNKVQYSGANTSRTYDPGVTPVALDSCSIAIAASAVARTFMVTAFVNFQPVGTHGIHANLGLDGVAVTFAQTQFCQVSGETARTGVMGPFPITVPGDNAAHTIDLLVADAGATGNLVFNQRYIFAERIA